jgi:rRNA-processing protein EBP2
MAKSKLKAALDAHKGVDYTAQKQKKKLRAGEKRSRDKSAKKPKKDEDVDVDMSEDDEEGGVLIDEEAVGTEIEASEEKKLQAELKALLGNKKKLMEIDSGSEVGEDEEEWESAAEEIDGEDDEDEDASDDEEQGVRLVKRGMSARANMVQIDLSRLVDSDSDSESEDDQEDAPKPKVNGKSKTNGTTKHSKEDVEEEDEEEAGSDIPLSDIESLASEDRGDIVPHQRLTINNKAALKKALDRISLPLSTLPFSAHQVIISQTNTANNIPDIDDDLARELAFYSQSLTAVKEARTKLTKEGTPFTRPTDYFAEMVKSDEHMGKVKDKLRDEAAGKKAAAEARRQRDLKKFGKQVQVAKMQERAKEKRDTLDRINVLKRSMPSPPCPYVCCCWCDYYKLC